MVEFHFQLPKDASKKTVAACEYFQRELVKHIERQANNVLEARGPNRHAVAAGIASIGVFIRNLKITKET